MNQSGMQSEKVIAYISIDVYVSLSETEHRLRMSMNKVRVCMHMIHLMQQGTELVILYIYSYCHYTIQQRLYYELEDITPYQTPSHDFRDLFCTQWITFKDNKYKKDREAAALKVSSYTMFI